MKIILSKDWRFTLISMIAILLVVGFALWLPMSTELRNLFFTSIIGWVFGIVLDAWKRQRSFEESKLLQKEEQNFALSVASHMSTVAYDYMIKFIDEYYSVAFQSSEEISELFQEGGAYKLVERRRELARLRWKYGPWINAEMEEKLLPFERSIGALGASASMSDLSDHDNIIIKKLREKMFPIYMHQINSKHEIPAFGDEDTINAVVFHLREMTGFNDLTLLRTQAIQEAKKHINQNSR